MSNEPLGSAPVVCTQDRGRAGPNNQHDFPDRWCIGLAHPYIQRLIFLAGALERGTVDVDALDCRPSQPD